MSTPEADAGRRPFAAFLQEHRTGSLHAELSDALAELACAVIEHGKSGTVTLTVKLGPNADGTTVTVTDDVKLNAPKGARGAAIYFVDEDGNVGRRDPRQLEIPLKEVTLPARAPRDLDDQKGQTA